MLEKFFKSLRILFLSAEIFDRKINQYKQISKENYKLLLGDVMLIAKNKINAISIPRFVPPAEKIK